jgi:transcription initiation factor IIF auxiliary subunit
MPYAVIRVAKIKTAQQASAKTAHNYREHSLSNVDQDAPHPNREYLNHEKRNYGELAEQRISQVVTRKVRADQVKAVEVVMTGSPEGFKRAADGRAVDYSKSKWAQDNLHFLQNKYGKENVVSFTLHQDEKTPHVHAVIVPITPDGRLAAKELFTPQTLRELQTEYAQAMQPHGFERGVEHSQTINQPPRRHYGQADQVGQLVPGPVLVQTVELGEIPLFGREEWKTKEQARVNEAFAQQVGQVQERVNKAVQQAQANASAPEQVKTLRKQLATSEGLKQAHFAQLGKAEQELTRLAIGAMQKDLPAVQALIDRGKTAREEVKIALTGHLEQILKGKVPDQVQFVAQLAAQGYRSQRTEQGTELVHELTGARFPSKEIRPNGEAIGPQLTAAVERSQKQEQDLKKGQSKGPKLR